MGRGAGGFGAPGDARVVGVRKGPVAPERTVALPDAEVLEVVPDVVALGPGHAVRVADGKAERAAAVDLRAVRAGGPHARACARSARAALRG